MAYELLFTGDWIKSRNMATGDVKKYRLRELSFVNKLGTVFKDDQLFYGPHPQDYEFLILYDVIKHSDGDYNQSRDYSWFKVWDGSIDLFLFDDKKYIDVQDVRMIPIEPKETELKYFQNFTYEADIRFFNHGNPIQVKRKNEQKEKLITRYTERGLSLYNLAKTFNEKIEKQTVTFDGLRMLDTLFPENQWSLITPEAIDKYAKA